MSAFKGVMAGAGSVTVLIGLLVTVPLKLHTLYMAMRLHDRGLE
ncbi:hypothetical protein [Gluconacetobacter entanii]|nr:hypothetical protein [Gluconacetobacter entanii]